MAAAGRDAPRARRNQMRRALVTGEILLWSGGVSDGVVLDVLDGFGGHCGGLVGCGGFEFLHD